MSIRLAFRFLTVACCALLASHAFGQVYPSRPIRIVTAGHGGGLDTVIRNIGNGISGPLGQSIVVENRPSTTFPQDRIAKGTPDGYTLGYFANNIWLGKFLRENMPYDPIKDFAPVSLTVMIPNALVVNVQLPVATVGELVALAKARPGELNAYVAGGGSPSFALFLFRSATGARFTTVRYKSIATGLIDVAAGTTHLIFPTLSSAQPLIKAGKIRALAVTSRERSPQSPELPTVAASGYPKFESVSVHALLAPPRTPADIVNRLNREVVRYLAQSESRAKVGTFGADVVASSPAELIKFMQGEMARMGPVFKEAGIKPGDLSE